MSQGSHSVLQTGRMRLPPNNISETIVFLNVTDLVARPCSPILKSRRESTVDVQARQLPEKSWRQYTLLARCFTRHQLY